MATSPRERPNRGPEMSTASWMPTEGRRARVIGTGMASMTVLKKNIISPTLRRARLSSSLASSIRPSDTDLDRRGKMAVLTETAIRE